MKVKGTNNRSLQLSIFIFALFFASPGAAPAQEAPKLWKEAESSTSKPVVNLPSFSGVVKQLRPSVVSFYVTTEIDMKNVDPMFNFFKDFFKDMPDVPDSYTQKGVGSGVIINENGYILTNSHVLDNVKTIKVVLDDGRTFEGQIVGSDEATDLALVKIDAPLKLQPAVLGNSDAVEIGDWVMAMGNPFGLEATVTAGIVSAIGRHEIGPPQLRYQDLIQTDAPINPGNSGGPLVDLAGNVLGITTAITASGQGIGFAIPINMCKEILPHLLKEGKVSRSWLGVTVQRLSNLLAKSYGAKTKEGALITEVHKDSPAWTTGLSVGDIILEFDGKKITTPDRLSWYASITGAGKKVKLKILRDGGIKYLTVKLAAMPTYYYNPAPDESAKSKTKPEVKKDLTDVTKGIKVSSIDKYTAAKLGLETKDGKVTGVIVTDLDENAALAKAGIDKGDIIADINGKICHGPTDFYKGLKKAKKGSIIRLYVFSKSKKGFIALKK